MAGILSKDIKLYYKASSSGTYTQIRNLQESPDIGGAANQVDVTTLENESYVYINGLRENSEMTFVFLYDNTSATSNYAVCRGIEETGKSHYWKVELPDETTFEFTGQASTTIVGQGVNSAIQFNLTINRDSDITVTMPDYD